MKKALAVLLLPFLGLSIAAAQEVTLKPTVSRPVYFDVSPPLRDMVKQVPGPVDRSWKDGAIPNRFGSDVDANLGQGSANGIDPVRQDQFGTLSGDTIVSNFDGLWNVSGYVPPDTYGEAGTNYYFQVVNCSYAIYNKSGGRIFGPVPNSSVWAGMPNNDNSGDAVVMYDENADRWFFSQFSLPNYPAGPFYQMIAVSQTADPMGSWYRYQYEYDYMNDYPKFGVWPDAYYMSCNFFGNGWLGNGAYAFDRTAMLTGEPDAVMVGFSIPPGGAGFITLYPSDCDGPLPAAGTPNYFGYIKLSTPQKFGLYEFHADFTNPGSSTFGNLLNLDVTSFNMLQDEIEQMGTNVRLESLDDRFMYRMQYRKFPDHASMVVNHTVGTTGGRAGIRWYELRKTSGAWSIYQQSTYSPEDENSRWMGSMAMDTAGSIALGYSVSGPNMYPAICYTGRKKSDPLNQMTIAERTIIAGGGCQTGVWSGRSRWGDYSGMSIDPDAPTTFWFTTEYYPYTSVSNWQTRIAAFTFDNNFSTSASVTPAKFCQGDTAQLEALAYGGSGNYTYSWSSIPPGFTSNLQNPLVWPSDTTTYIVAISDGTQTKQDTAWVKVVPAPQGSAGNDTTVCAWAYAIDLVGTASNYKHIVWGSLGDGHFSNHYTLNTIYYPGPEDRANGGADIKLVIFAKAPCQGKLFRDKHITIDACTGTENTQETLYGLTLIPNPAHDKATVTISMPSQTTGQLTLTATDGRVCYSEQVISSGQVLEHIVDLSGFSRGVYVVMLKTDKQVITKRLIVQ
jgi:hypothetical protein